MKKWTMSVLGILAAFVFSVSVCGVSVYASDGVTYGADIGLLSQLEADGITWVDDNGTEKDALEILKNKGVEAVRIRAFVKPNSNFQWTKDDGSTCYLGYCDTKGVVYTAKRAADLGLDVDIVLHYSDHYADPLYQDIPSEWEGASAKELEKYVYDYTAYLMTQLANEGVYPKWVEVGNEINGGMLFPYGDSTNNFEQLTAYLNSGYDAVKAVSPNTKVVTHLTNLGQYQISSTDFTWFFENFLTTYGGKTDVIGMSYYPYWTGYDIDGVADTFYTLAEKYNKEVMICETGEDETNAAGAYKLLRQEINVMKSIPNNKGVAVFYLEPEANSEMIPDGYTLGATEKVTGNKYKFTSALDAFKLSPTFLSSENTFAIKSCNSKKTLNVSGGSQEDSASIEQYGYDEWDSQKWYFVKVENGYYRIVNKNSNKVLEVTGMSTEAGASCTQYTYNGGWNQMWKVITTDDGKYKLQNRLSGLYLGVADASSNDGALCVQLSDDNSNNVKWSFLVTE